MKKMMLTVLAIALELTACGPDGGQSMAVGVDAGADVTPTAATEGLLGLWQYTAGTVRGACSDGSSLMLAPSGTETFTDGSRPNALVATDDRGCTETCVLSGGVVRCSSDEPCNGNSVTSDEFTLSGDELHENATGEVTLDDGTTCDVSLAAGVLARAR